MQYKREWSEQAKQICKQHVMCKKPCHRQQQMWVLMLIPEIPLVALSGAGLRRLGARGLLALGVIDAPLGLINTNFAVQLGLFYSYLPFMVLPIYAALERLDFRLVEAAYDLYATRWRVLVERSISPIPTRLALNCGSPTEPRKGQSGSPTSIRGPIAR